jgi:hypothetical protein
MSASRKSPGSGSSKKGALTSNEEPRREAGSVRGREGAQTRAERTQEGQQTEAEREQEAPGAGSDGQSGGGADSQRARQERAAQGARSGPGMQGRGPSDEPDVFLDIPQVHVGEIYFDVEDLDAHLSLRAKVANLVQIIAGVHVHVGKVELDMKEVDAEALLKVRLENLYDILDRVLTTLDRNPEVLQGLLNTVGSAVDDIGQSAQQALGPGGAAAEAVDQVGGATQQAVQSGGAVSQTAGAAGQAAQGAGDAAGQAAQGVGNAAGQTAQGVGNAPGQAGQVIGQGAGQAAAQDPQGGAQNAQDAVRGSDGTDAAGGNKQKQAPLAEALALLKQAENSGSASRAGA